jgi:hypothetical protein
LHPWANKWSALVNMVAASLGVFQVSFTKSLC